VGDDFDSGADPMGVDSHFKDSIREPYDGGTVKVIRSISTNILATYDIPRDERVGDGKLHGKPEFSEVKGRMIHP